METEKFKQAFKIEILCAQKENFEALSLTREVVGNIANVGDMPPEATIIPLKLLNKAKKEP